MGKRRATDQPACGNQRTRTPNSQSATRAHAQPHGRRSGGPWPGRPASGSWARPPRPTPRAEKSRGKKQRRKAEALTRYELAARLAVGLTTLDKLIGFGAVRAVGARGPAKLYDVEAVRRAIVRLAPAEAAAAEIVKRDLEVHAEDLRDRLHHLQEAFVPDEAWIPLWQAVVNLLASLTRSWPAHLAAIVGTLSPSTARSLDAAPLPVTPGTDPWSPIPFLRPLLAELKRAMAASDELRALDQALRAPEAPPIPAAPTTVAQARSLWRSARANFRERRVAVRRGHHRRDLVVRAVGTAFKSFRATWWSWRGAAGRLAGDGAEARRSAEALRAHTLRELATLGGLLPEERQAAA